MNPATPAPEDNTALPGQEDSAAAQAADETAAPETGDDQRAETVEANADSTPAEADPQEPDATVAEPDAAPTENAADPEAAAADSPAAEQAPPRSARGPGVLALLAGGVLAAVIGFGAARFVIPEGWPFGPVSQATRDLTQALDAQGARIDSLRADLDALPGTLTARIEDIATTAESGISGLRDDMGARIDALSADVTALQDSLARLDAFDARLTALERRPVADGAASRAAIESFGRELADLRDLLEQERARNAAAEAEIEQRAQALRDEAAELARQTARTTAEDQIARALAMGGGFPEALETLESAGIAIPEALRQHAGTGVATLESLQEGFAAPARAALKATADTNTGAIGAFLRNQFGIRSLSPQEGDSVDAILSRAEAAVKAGDLAGALAELGTLPPEGQAAMADWRAAAEARKDVVAAAASVTQ